MSRGQLVARKTKITSYRRMFVEPLEDRRMLAIFMVTHLGDAPVTMPGQQPGSLHQAIFDANNTAGTDTIVFDAGVSGTIDLNAGELLITDAVTINGPGAEMLAINPTGSRVFNINAAATSLVDVMLSGLTITGGSDVRGGGIENHENLTIVGSTISGNGTGAGGGIYSVEGLLVVRDSQITNNYVSNLHGGGVFLAPLSSGVFERTIIDDNFAYSHGGGIHAAGDLTLDNCLVTANHARNGRGGGVFSTGAETTITASTIDGNSTGGFGGGIGGGVFAENGSLSISDSAVADNYAQTGSGIFVDSSELTLTTSEISGNSGTGVGGGIYARLVVGEITDSTVSDNYSYYGGGIFAVDSALTIAGDTLNNNTATSYGGGIHASVDSSLDVVNSTMSGNFASRGAGVYVDADAEVRIASSTITDNSAHYASGIHAPSSLPAVVSLANTIVAQNQSVYSTDIDGEVDALFSMIGGDPQLGPLADNGGPTMTHALLPGSPAINAGDPTAMAGTAGTPEFDQRGNPFTRVFDADTVPRSRIDIGAFEVQPIVVDGDFNDDGLYDSLDINALVAAIAAGTNGLAFDLTGDGLVNLSDRDAWLAEAGEVNLGAGRVYLLGDINLDGVVDGLDFIAWNANKFTSVAAWSAGDLNADGVVDGLDFIIWNANKFQGSSVRCIVARLSHES